VEEGLNLLKIILSNVDDFSLSVFPKIYMNLSVGINDILLLIIYLFLVNIIN
jgi:hypothetical protein